MITVHDYTNFLDPLTRRTRSINRRFARVSALAPREWNGEYLAIVNGARADRDRLVFAGDFVSFVATPGAGLTVPMQILLLVAFSVVQYALRPRLRPPTARDENKSALYSFDGITANRSEGQPIPSYYGRIRAGGQIVNEFVESRGAAGSWYNVLICYGYGPIQSIAGVTEDTDPGGPLRSRTTAPYGIPSGVFINGTEASEFLDVEMHVRLGTSEQLAIPGFDRDTLTVAIQQGLTAPEGTSLAFDPFISMTAPSTSEDPSWALYGIAHDFTDREIDAFTVKVRAAGGFYAIDNSNNVIGLWMSIAVRYIELDALDLPITTGGPDGDGYVRLRPTRQRSIASQDDMRVDFPFTLYDPQTFAQPSASGAGNFLGTLTDNFPSNTYGGNFYRDASLMTQRPPGWAVDADGIDEMSCFAWIAMRPNGPDQGDTSEESPQDSHGSEVTSLHEPAGIFEWLNYGNSRGFSLSIENCVFQPTPGQTRQRLAPVVRTGNGTTVKEFFPRNSSGAAGPGGTSIAPRNATDIGDVPFRLVVNLYSASISAQTWFHVGFTYKRNVDGTNDRLRIFVDGEVVLEVYADIGLKAPSTNTQLTLGCLEARSGSIYTQGFIGFMEEAFIHTKELLPSEVEDRYNVARGLFEDDVARCFCCYHFDDNYPTGLSGHNFTLTDSGGMPTPLNMLSRQPSGTVASHVSSGVLKSFIDRDVATNVPKRSKYRIEVMRATRDYTPADGTDDLQLEAIVTHVDAGFTYPEAALMALRIRADEQVSGGAPEVSAILEGALVQVWDGEDIFNPNLPLQFTRNPAWILRDLCVNARRGLGSVIREKDVDLVSTKAWADYNDELVYNLRGGVLDIDSTNTAEDIYDIQILPSGGQVSQLWVQLGSSRIGAIPSGYRVGVYVGFTGLPAVGTYNLGEVVVDMNESASDGWLITDIDDGSVTGLPRIYLEWDATARGADLPWTLGGLANGSLLTSISPTTFTGTMRGLEKRHSFDGGFDEASGGWDALIEACDTASCVPLRSGRRVFFHVDAPRPAIDLVTPANIQAGSFEIDYGSNADKPNTMTVEILDEEANFDRAFVPDEHPSVAGTASIAEIRDRSVRLRGVTRRSQAKRWAREALNQNYLVRRTGKYVASADALPHEAGDVLQIAANILPRGVGGRVLAGSTTTQILLDRRITLEASTTYKLAVRSALAPVGEYYTVSTVVSGAGTYEGRLGEAIEVNVPFGFVPQHEDVFILHEDGAELKVVVRSIGLTRDLLREVSWSEYVEDVFIVDGDELDDLPGATLAATSSDGYSLATLPNRSERALPARVDLLRARESVIRTAAGTHATGVTLTWIVNQDEPAALEQIIWRRYGGGAWAIAQRVGAGATTCFVAAERVRPGTIASFAVQVVSRGGSRRDPDQCGVISLALYGQGPTPEEPASLTAVMQGGQAVYSFAAGDTSDAVSFELRRGGWVLGQVVFTQPHGATRVGPTDDFTTAVQINAPGFEQGAPLLLRARSAHGRWSSALDFLWSPRTLDGASLSDMPDDAFVSQEWREFGHDGGWANTSGFPNATLTDLEVDGNGDLRFSGSALTGTYTTPTPEVPVTEVSDDFHVSAFLVAQQIHPMTWAQAAWRWNDPAASQVTWEGPINELGDGEDARCTATIEVRYLGADFEWSGWRAYKPSRTTCIMAQFRFTVTRPSADYDVRVRRFSTELIRVAPNSYDRTSMEHFLRQRSRVHG